MNTPYTLIQLQSVDSTNRYLKDYVSEHQPCSAVFCITEQQTAGYGQQNRKWQTNKDSAIFSWAVPLNPQDKITGLVSLQIATLLHQSLTEITKDMLQLKWPNDLYNTQGKVAGILIEQVVKKDYRALIIGIGINRNHNDLIASASSVSQFKTETLIDKLFKKTELPGLVNFSVQSLLDYWQTHDMFAINEPIELITAENANSKLNGIYLGINQNGQALINLNGKIQTLTSGQTSIRKSL
ncbi:hypothetical protein JCM30760_17350 [Thiomicrorhabdus hydrogeniphila]